MIMSILGKNVRTRKASMKGLAPADSECVVLVSILQSMAKKHQKVIFSEIHFFSMFLDGIRRSVVRTLVSKDGHP